jgi:hypothetical protein
MRLFWLFVLSCRTLKWVRKYLSARGMSGHESVDLLRVCVKDADCCDPSSTGTLTCVEYLESCVESAFATISE